MQLQLPTTTKLRRALRDTKQEIERIADRAIWYRHDEATLRLLENEWQRMERCRLDTALGTRLGTELGTALGLDSGSLFSLFRQGFQPGDSLFDASYYAVDGGSGKVSDWIDYIDPTHTLRQSTGARQVAVPTADATLASALTASFVAATGNWYDSTRAASSFSFLHSGSGGEVTVVCVPVTNPFGFLLCTRPVIAFSETGFSLTSNSAGVTLRMLIGNSSSISGATSTVETGQISTGTAFGAPLIANASYVESASPEYRVASGSTLIASGASATAPSANDPAATLRLGAGTTGGVPANMRFRLSPIHRRVMSTAERAVELAYIRATTGAA